MCSKCYNQFQFDEMIKIVDDFYVCKSCFEKIKISNPREKTTEEAQEDLIRHLWTILEYWYKESRTPDTFDKMAGLLHSVLTTFDGASGGMPGFKIIPNTTLEDNEFLSLFGESWYNDKEDIGGYLHELLNRYGPTDEEQNKMKLSKTRGDKLTRINK